MLSPRWLLSIPASSSCCLASALLRFLFSGPVQIAGGIRLDTHTFLVAAIAILIEIQNLTFGLIAQRFAVKYQILPEPKQNRLLSLLTFERGLIVAVLLTGPERRASFGRSGAGLP